jgi:hypothetical protein
MIISMQKNATQKFTDEKNRDIKESHIKRLIIALQKEELHHHHHHQKRKHN